MGGPEPAFWDTSALVLLCAQQKGSGTAERLSARHSIVVWWAAPVEIRSAIARLVRMGLLPPAENRQARERADGLRESWREIEPHEEVRRVAESLLDRFALRAADSLQLAAALNWCRQRPRHHGFISGDKQLLAAAGVLGFQAIEV